MIIHHNESHEPLPPRTIVAIDTELYGMRKERLHWNNEGKFASLQYTWDGENIYVVTDEKKVSSAMELIKDSTHIFHNAYFDIIHLRRWCDYPDRTNMYDTMLLEKLLFSGYYDTFGLADLARRYLGIIVEKETREDFATKTKMTKEMLEYSALDASLTHKVFHKQKELIKDRRDVLKIWKLIDQPALYALVDLLDVTIDIETWDRIAEENEQRAIEIKKEAEERWGINIGSTIQVQKILNKRGLNVSSAGEKVLNRLLKRKQKDDLIEKVLEYRYSSKRASTYGKKMHEEMFEDDGRARPGFKVSEAMTGRMASASWNLQNVPAEEKYRACIIAKPGHKILVTDYAAQEPRITAYESEDELLVKMTQIKGESIHVSVGRELFDDPKLDKKDKRYKAAKGLNLGLQYGLTAVGLQRDLNDKKEEDEPLVSREDAKNLLNMYFSKFPKVREWSSKQRNSVRNPGYVETKLGRRCWLNPYNWQSGNNALNSPIQGGAADITKYALSEVRKQSYKRWGEWYCFGVVHDEIDFSVPIEIFDEHKNMVESIMVKCAEQIYKGITFEVESKWGDNWACKMEEE